MKFLTSVKHLLLLCSVLVPLSVTADLLDSVIFVGDSDVYYWGLQGNSDAFIPGSVNVGVSGWTCADVNGKINDWLEQYEPTLVIFKCGTNDMWGSGQVGPEEAFDRFTKVIDKISATNVPVIAMSTKPEIPVLAAGAPAERWQQFNALVKSYAVGLENNEIPAGLPVLSFIDSYEGLLAVGNSPTLYASDIIHLSADGYSYWNTWVDTTIDLLMSEEGSDCAVWLSNECELFLETSVESPSSFAPVATPLSTAPNIVPITSPSATPVSSLIVVPVAIPSVSSGKIPSCTGINLLGMILFLGFYLKE